MNLNTLKKIYFLGIGGIGMSALARYFLSKGVEIYGYDLTQSSLTKKLEAEGMVIHYFEDVNLIPKNIDMVIYTPAVPKDNVEYLWFRDNGFTIKKRAEVLGLISREQNTIAVAGTHGKTSTSSLMSHILKYCGLDVSAFLGGIVKNFNSNYLTGKSEYVVLEADEYDRSFLHLYPEILIITSLDADHLDIYRNHRSMIDAYEQLCCQINDGGTLVLMGDFSSLFSDNWNTTMKKKSINILQLDKDFSFNNVSIKNEKYHFDFLAENIALKNLISVMPGLHNISNASASVLIALQLGCSEEMISKALNDFKGIKRRFELLYDDERTLIDDYAHHPNELKVAVETVNSLYEDRHILGIFQPHLYSRTLDFYKEFAAELGKLNEVWILEIYPAREKPIKGVESEIIYNLIRNDNKRIIKSKDLITTLNKEMKRLDVIITIGASDLDKYHDKIIEIIKQD